VPEIREKSPTRSTMLVDAVVEVWLVPSLSSELPAVVVSIDAIVLSVDPDAAAVLSIDPDAAVVLLVGATTAVVLLVDPDTAAVLAVDPEAAVVLSVDPDTAVVLSVGTDDVLAPVDEDGMEPPSLGLCGRLCSRSALESPAFALNPDDQVFTPSLPGEPGGAFR
jgi:hypothetical protein